MKKIILLIPLLLMFFSTTQVYALEGWSNEKGEKYYYRNNEKVEGFQQIDGKTYFFGIGTKRLLHG